MMQLRLLGPFELRRIDGGRVALPGRQSMAILACLGLSEGFSLARERLAELIWAGRGEEADGSLRQELVRLRRALGEDSLPAGGAVTLNADRIDISPASAPPPAILAAPRKRSRSIADPCWKTFRCGRGSRSANGSTGIGSVCATSREP
jgi:DNA-binding SARP family transcriptional activator